MPTESELHAQIEELKATLITAQAEQWKLVRSVCHELRLPLTAIKGYIDLLPLMGPVNDQQKDFVTRIKKNVGRMSGMITNLHELAFMGENKIMLKLMALPVAHYADKVCRELEPVAAEHGNTLTSDVPDSLPTVLADRERLEQILRILIENACWYTPAGGKVTVTAGRTDDHHVQISVIDTGIGVPEGERASLFTLFFRGDSQVVREQTGAGMNLYMLRRFVEMLDGAYGADFPPEGGSCFWVRLPVAG
jgi:two-component system, OmpR family, phosphate regulon sensor histidine kinase PhoR